MAARNYIILSLLLFTASCSEDESTNGEPGGLLETVDTRVEHISTSHTCDSIAIETSLGTSCCVSGPALANAGDVVRYHYQINQDHPEIYWVILEGDIQIVAGQDTHTATVIFGSDFVSGKIQGRAKGNMINNVQTIRCEEAVNINSQ